jgi:hypothetical protein
MSGAAGAGDTGKTFLDPAITFGVIGYKNFNKNDSFTLK